MPSVEMREVNLVQEIMECGVGAMVRTVAERKTQVLAKEEADTELSLLLRLESRISVAGYCVFFFFSYKSQSFGFLNQKEILKLLFK